MRLTRRRGLLGATVLNASLRTVDGFAHLLRKGEKKSSIIFLSSARPKGLSHSFIDRFIIEQIVKQAGVCLLLRLASALLEVGVFTFAFVCLRTFYPLWLQQHFNVFNLYQMQSMTT